MRALLIIFVALALAATAQNLTIKTGRAHKRPLGVETPVVTMPLDTVVASKGDITVKGYDKPRRSRKETMFVTNNTARPLAALVLTVEYTDMQGRQLHRRRLREYLDVPSGQTRMLTVKTWDVQNAFYYYRTASGGGRTAATPYQVKCHVDTLIFTL